MEKQRADLTPEQDALEHIVAGQDKPFLEERFIDSFKGRGVFTRKTIEASMFVVEYRGKTLCHKNPNPTKKCSDTLNNYLYEFSWKDANWCIDASKEDGTLGRLVNDDHIGPNCEMKKIVWEGKPHLCLFAVKEVSPGEEITYSYGDSYYPWRLRLEDSAASSSKKSCSGDGDKVSYSGPSHDSDSLSPPSLSDKGQLGFRTRSETVDSSHEMTGSDTLEQDDNSCGEQDEAAPCSDEYNSDNINSEDEKEAKTSSLTRKNYCYVCGKGLSKIARHLLRHAKAEPDIAEAFALPKKSKERKRLLEDLRNRGNYKHNQEVLRSNSGMLKLRRRSPGVAFSTKLYTHCPHCKSILKRKDLWRHVSRCNFKKKPTPRGETSVVKQTTHSEPPLSQKPSGVLRILSSMKQDEISITIQNDSVLMELAEYLSEKYENSQNKNDYIRQKLREMGRLLLALHEKSILSFEDAIKPINFDRLVDTVKALAGFDKEKQCYAKPGLVLKLGHSLKKIGSIFLSRSNANKQLVSDAKMFMELCTKRWTELVSSSAFPSRSGQGNSPSTIPFTHDVQTFYRYLETASASAVESMKVCDSPQVYSALCRVTLAQVSALNKGEPEVSTMRLKSFQERDDTTQVLSKHFIRINILSRTGPKIAVLLTSELVSAIKLLVSKRTACGVHKDNPFLFAKPDSSASSLYYGESCIKAYSSLCHAVNPKHLRSLHLQKHIARVFQILNLENDELGHLSKLLGHDIRADRDYYRLPEAAVELAKIAKLLLAKEKGSLKKMKGNSLDEIEIEDELEPDVVKCKPENSDAEENDEESDVFLKQSGLSESSAQREGGDVERQGRQLSPEQDALKHIKARRDKPFLEEMFIDLFKGRGVFTHESIKPSAFVVEYRGNISLHSETQNNQCGDSLNNYLFDFSWSGTNWRVDASAEDGTLGRLVNDDHISPNCEMRKVVYEGKPHLCLFALKKIPAGEEITYNYGDSSYPWRSATLPTSLTFHESRMELNRPHSDRNASASSPRDEKAEDSTGAVSSAESCSDDDGDYVPDDESSGGSGSSSHRNKDFKQLFISDSSIQQDETDNSSEELSGPSHHKRNYCYVCGKAMSKISRHLFTHRNEEADIAKAFILPLLSKERKRLLKNLRNRGNNKHKENILKSNPPKTFAQCLYCKGMYKKIWKHMQQCSATGTRARIFSLAAAADPKEISSDVSKILQSLKKDEIASVVCNDSYILQMAQCLVHMGGKKRTGQEYIKQKLREMGRLLLTLKKKSVCSFEDAMKPQNFSKVVEVVRELTALNEETKVCDRPRLLKSLRNSLKVFSDMKYARAFKEGADKEVTHEVKTFLTLCAKELTCVISSKINHPATIPFTQDVQLFYQCMETTVASAVESMTMYESPPVYNALLRAILAQVSILNKNVVEVSRVTLQSFKERDETELQDEAAVCQSQFEEILFKRYVKFKLKSRSDTTVPVTLTPELLHAIRLLVTKRETCGVNINSPFLFAKPDGICTTYCQGQRSITFFAAQCGAKDQENLRSPFFRKSVARICQILSLTNEQLAQLAKLLGRDIQTDPGSYRTPEAAAIIAKISELLSAMEDGSLERFEGKSLEEIEIADELQPDVKQDHVDSSDEEEDKETERSFQLSGVSPSKVSSAAKKRVSSSRKRGRCEEGNRVNTFVSRRRMQESDNEESELYNELNEGNSEEDDGEEDLPLTSPVNTPEKTSHSKEDTMNMYFSDDDEDMNVDYDIDTDEDIANYKENDEESVNSGSHASKPTNEDENISNGKKDSSPNRTLDTDLEQTMDSDTENHLEKAGEQTDHMDVGSSSSSAILNSEKKIKLSAAVIPLKEVKIVIPKLDVMRSPVHISELSSVLNTWPVKDQPRQEDQCETSSSTDVTNKPSDEKAIHMTCFHCNKGMMKGQTAYQKKGFTDVFCSKNCLFEIFPIKKPATKTCHFCLKAIVQPLDIIMAVVDIKGTVKDFCSVTCLSSFKSNTQTAQSLCSLCNKSCTNTYELTLKETVHTFCSDSCLEGFRRNNMVICENCSSSCSNKPLRLKLEEDTKTVCSEECLKEFKENIKTSQQCTMCHTSTLVSDMIDYKSSEEMVELFCSLTCVTSYKLQPAIVYKLKGKRGSSLLMKKKKSKLLKRKSNTEGVKISSDSTGNKNAASPAAVPTLFIADSCIVCCNCGTKLPKGQTLYQTKSSPEVFCSASCLSEKHPNINLVTKNCYNCLQVIMRPQNIILAPVDDSGTMKELCSEMCLSSVQSKRSIAAPKPPPLLGPRTECRMCAKFCFCKFKLTLDGVVHRLCNDTCFITYHRINNLPVITCDMCSSVCHDKHLTLKMVNGSKNICSKDCLLKFKEKVEQPQLCPMCQTSHLLSDMVEKQNKEGTLNFFCSSRCMMLFEAHSFQVFETSSPPASPEEKDIKDVKASLPSLDCIKQEPADDKYEQNLSLPVFRKDVKDEPNVTKEDLKIGSVFSLKGDSRSAAPIISQLELPASCSNCTQALMNGETVYQRKAHSDMFCSTSCLLKFYLKPVQKTCHFCLQAITQPQNIHQALVDTEGTKKDFCSQICLSSFNYKKVMSTKLPHVSVKSHSQCSMCSRYCISKHEVIQEEVIHKFCSDPCVLRFCTLNNLLICKNCHCHCSTPLMLKMEDGNKNLCSAECLAQFKQTIQTPQPCALCRSSAQILDMVESKNSEDMVELFCTSGCVMASKIQAVSASGIPLNCDKCGKATAPTCHITMSDASLRNFCNLTCAMAFNDTHKDPTAAPTLTAPDQTQSGFTKSPEKLLCAQCLRHIKNTPKVIQNKDRMNFVCTLACSQEFKRVNNITGTCAYCKNERIIKDAKRIDNEDCFFCRDTCVILLRHQLKKKWGKHCESCAYCFSVSKTVVTAEYEGTYKEFCSEDCSSNYKMLFCCVAKCDTCGRKGKLRQSLPLLGEVKHFCDLKCVLHFCNKKVQTVTSAADSSPAGSSGPEVSSPIITNVISLDKQPGAFSSTAQYGSAPDVGHASIQTVSKEMKNKSTLCTPLVHNKGVSCVTQTVDTEAQTDNFLPTVIVLPVPVPVYVPLPMNLYTQYMPKPVALPLPLPVPVFLPGMSGPTMKARTERIWSKPSDEELSLSPEMETRQQDRNRREDLQTDREVTEEEERQDALGLMEHTSRRSLGKHDLESLDSQQEPPSDTKLRSPRQSHAHETPPSGRDAGVPSEPQPPSPAQTSPTSAPASPLLQQTEGNYRKKGHNLQQLTKAAKQRDSAKDTSRKHIKKQSLCGIDAWERWIQWRKSQTNLHPESTRAVELKDVLCCSAAELSDGLCCFINEVKQPDGEPYAPDGLFYLCLSIQQYLLENRRMENIFSDVIYSKFSTEFTNKLRCFKPSVTASGYVHSRVEEEFLWDCKQLGAYSPIVLLNTLLFFCCKYFGFTTVEQHRQLSFANVMCGTRTNPNNTKTTFLRFYPPISINEPESDTDGVPAKKRKRSENEESFLEVMENTETILRCPVRLYKFYLSKCSELVKRRSDLFYLQPDRSCVPSSPLWFSSAPLDYSIMEAMLVRVLAVRELQDDCRGQV
ncbi:uncharacterized protein LOC113126760 [Mastacembelus armatus]|uniref:uncharacterized protein LOC113126760 n=1 Tax=Mastacembelus armatus TaxID=205130 RepID=UPI000E463CE2|nr:uncharacterized protein LOC113126760 [Mastacembelus armatus]XP_026156665.1 uncharacterized protein LOC113126760 [Mastacembelus armatus]